MNPLFQLIALLRKAKDPTRLLNTMIDEAGIAAAEQVLLAETVLGAVGERGVKLLGDSRGTRCSFCWKAEGDVEFLVRAPNATICNECIKYARRSSPRTGWRRWLLGPKLWETSETAGLASTRK